MQYRDSTSWRCGFGWLGTDFAKYHTYKWVEIPSNIHPNQIVDQEIRQAVNNALAAKSFTLTTGATADVYVGYQCPLARSDSGMPGGWAVDFAGAAEWGRLRVQQSQMECLASVFTIPLRNNSSGVAPRHKR
jgi:hypothetical protein